MNKNEQTKELTDKELEGVAGGRSVLADVKLVLAGVKRKEKKASAKVAGLDSADRLI